jgi:excisionase family DNA binding protein
MKPLNVRIAVTINDDSVAVITDVLQGAIDGGITMIKSAISEAVKSWQQNDRPQHRQPMMPIELPHPLFAGQKPSEDVGLLIDTRELSKLLKVSERTIWSMQASGRMPAPIRIGRAVRWSYEGIKAWIAVGCPASEP